MKIVKPRKFHGGIGPWLNRTGVIVAKMGRYCVLVLDEELDELGFFEDELEVIS